MYSLDLSMPLDEIAQTLEALGHASATTNLSNAIVNAIAEDDGRAVLILAMAHCVWRATPIPADIGLAMANIVRRQGIPAGESAPVSRNSH